MAVTRYVRELDGAWEILEEGARRGVARVDTKEKAVARARAIVKREGGGEVQIVNRAGKIERASRVGRKRRRGA